MQDIKTDENHEVIFRNGDFLITHSDEQHQHHILLANKGEYKRHPEVGVGIVDMLNNEEYTAMMLEAKKQLEYDGMGISNIRLNEQGKLIIDGKYKD